MPVLIRVVLGALCCSLAPHLFAADVLQPKQLILLPAADTMIHDTVGLPPGGGSSPTVAVGTTRDGRHAEMLFIFEVPLLPPDAILTNVYVGLTVAQAPSGGAAAPFSLHQLLRNWDENDATWNSASSGETGLIPWSAPGAEPGADYVAAPAAINTLGASGHYTFEDPTLLDLARLWMTNHATNFGFIMICDSDATQTAKRVYTREQSIPDQEPQLVLEYLAPLRITFTRAERNGDLVEFDFTAEPGHSYVVEYKSDVNGNTWTMFATFPAPASTTTYSFCDFPDQERRFYRVVAQ